MLVLARGTVTRSQCPPRSARHRTASDLCAAGRGAARHRAAHHGISRRCTAHHSTTQHSALHVTRTVPLPARSAEIQGSASRQAARQPVRGGRRSDKLLSQIKALASLTEFRQAASQRQPVGQPASQTDRQAGRHPAEGPCRQDKQPIGCNWERRGQDKEARKVHAVPC